MSKRRQRRLRLELLIKCKNNYMLGFFLAITASSLFAARGSINKYVSGTASPLFIYWVVVLFSLPVFTVGVLIQGMPPLTSGIFWLMVGLGVPLYVGTSVLLIRAMQISPLWATLPFLGFSPVFLLLTSWLILGQIPSAWGVLGVMLVTVGAYLIHFQGRRAGWTAPFRTIHHERGSWYVIVIALIWSVVANFDKIALDHSTPMSYLFIYSIISLIALTIALIWRRELGSVKALRTHPIALPLTGFTTLLQMMAIQLILVPYVITIKRAGSILGGIGIGAVYFRELGFRKRIGAGIIMLIGVAIILILS